MTPPSAPISLHPEESPAACDARQGERAFAGAEHGGLLFQQRQRARGRCLRAIGRGKLRMLGEKGVSRIARPYRRIRENRAELAKIGR